MISHTIGCRVDSDMYTNIITHVEEKVPLTFKVNDIMQKHQNILETIRTTES